MDNVQYYFLTIQASVQRSLWYTLGVQKPFGCGAMASLNPKIHFSQKPKMAPSSLVWPQFFFGQKTKVANFCEPLEGAKSETSYIKN